MPPKVNPEYDDPSNYDKSVAYPGDRRLPPDWEARRRVIWRRQSGSCARCRNRLAEEAGDVHHIQPLRLGGQNSLENLAGLCDPCHALMHPEQPEIGFHSEAPLFPKRDANPKVAVIRKPTKHDNIDPDLIVDLETLDDLTEPDENQFAVSYATYGIPSKFAPRLPAEIKGILEEFALIAESTDYYELIFTVKLAGIRGIFSRYIPNVESTTDGALVTSNSWAKSWRSRTKEFQIAEDGTELHLSIEEDVEIEGQLSFELSSTKLNAEVEVPSPPLM